MRDPQHQVIDAFASDLERTYTRTFGAERPELAAALAEGCRLALEPIAGSDMAYHNVEHTVLVTTVGQHILIGKALRDGEVGPSDWLHFILALLCHDVGYVRGVCRKDADNRFVTGHGDETVTLPEGSTNAALTPYHVSRSQEFVREHFGPSVAGDCDPERIASYIEMTRFPPPESPEYQATGTYAGLARAADFIGQFGDRNYLHKLAALFSEFNEIGANEAMGYTRPDDIRSGFATFFKTVVSPYIQNALVYLNATAEGREWVAALYANVEQVERRPR